MTEPIDLEAIKRKHAADDATAWAPHTWTHIHRGQLIAEVGRLHAMVAELERT